MKYYKHARNVECHGCKHALELIDALTWEGWYWCESCLFDVQKHLTRDDSVAALAKMENEK